MNKLQKAKFMVPKDEYGKYDIFRFGKFTNGLTESEVDQYFMVVRDSIHIKKMKNAFRKFMGGQTCGVYFCPKCSNHESLFYRWDVSRFVKYNYKEKK